MSPWAEFARRDTAGSARDGYPPPPAGEWQRSRPNSGYPLPPTPCPLPLVFSFSFFSCFFVFPRASGQARKRDARHAGPAANERRRPFLPASQSTLSQLCLVGPQPPSHHPIEFSAAIHRAACEYVYVYTCNCLLPPRAPRLPSTPHRLGASDEVRPSWGCHAGVALCGLGGYVTRPEGR